MLDYNKFEKLSDIVLLLEYNIEYKAYLKMNTKLGSKNRGGYREPFVKAFAIGNEYRGSNENLISVKRDFSYYLSLEVDKDKDFFIMIYPHNMILFKTKLEEAFVKWFSSDDIWTRTAEGYPKVMISKVIPIEIHGLAPNNKSIRLDPIVIIRPGLIDKGMRITVSTSSTYLDLDMDKVMALLYTFSTFNMYMAALSQINALSVYDHPRFVQELVQMDQTPRTMEDESMEKSEGVNRSPIRRRPKSFFDRDDLSELEE